MKLSTRARYALRAMLIIAREGEENKPVNLREVAKRTEISHRYLEQVAIALKHAKLLKAYAGKKGGHLLARPADEIKLSEIVTAAIGEINLVECVGSPELCLRSEACECRNLYRLLNRRLVETLEQYSLADLANGKISVEE